MPVDWRVIRSEFPAVQNWTYLNTATMGLMSRATRASVDAHFARREELANTDFLTWWDEVDCLRALLARLLGCAASDISFFPNTSSVLALALRAIQWHEGDEILTLTDEFPNQTYCNAELPGVRLVETALEKFWEAVSPSTRMVAISSVNYQTGLRAPWESMISRLRAHGILTYIDATQSFAILRTSLRENPPDVFAVNCYKWACAPPGAAFAYVHPQLRERLQPSTIGWRSDANWRDMHNLRHADPVFSESSEKYEGGMLAFPSLAGLKASLEMIEGIGQQSVEARVLGLAKRCGGDGTSPIVTLKAHTENAEEAAELLKAERILVSARKGRLRISPHFYNDESDVDRLLTAIAAQSVIQSS